MDNQFIPLKAIVEIKEGLVLVTQCPHCVGIEIINHDKGITDYYTDVTRISKKEVIVDET